MSDQNTLPTTPEINPWDSTEPPKNPETTADFNNENAEAAPIFDIEPTEQALAETPSEQSTQRTTGAPRRTATRTTAPAAATLHPTDRLTVQIETIMEDGLGDVFKELTPVQQQEFKIKGEETARKIRELLTHTKIKIKEIFALILGWLKFLPGINRFYLEQEAKIKADKILALSKQQTE